MTLPLCGHHRELRLEIWESWSSVRDGQTPSVVFVVGESGHGKTRLLQSFYETLSEQQNDVYWLPGLELVNLPDSEHKLEVGRKRIKPEFNGNVTPEWLWLALLCSKNDAGDSVDIAISDLVSQLDQHVTSMHARETQQFPRLGPAVAGAIAAVPLVHRIISRVPIISELSAADELRRDMSSVPSSLNRILEAWRSTRALETLDSEVLEAEVLALKTSIFKATIDEFDDQPVSRLPLILVLDDAHMAHPHTLRLIASLLAENPSDNNAAAYFAKRANLQQRPILILVAHIPSETTGTPLEEWVAELEATNIPSHVVELDQGARFGVQDARALIGASVQDLTFEQIRELDGHLTVEGTRPLPHSIVLALTKIAEAMRMGVQPANIDDAFISSLPQFPEQALENRFDRLFQLDAARGTTAQQAYLGGAVIGRSFLSSGLNGISNIKDWHETLVWAQCAGGFVESTGYSADWQPQPSAQVWSFETTEAHQFTLRMADDLPIDYKTLAIGALENELRRFAALDVQGKSQQWRRTVMAHADRMAGRLIDLAGDSEALLPVLSYAHALKVEMQYSPAIPETRPLVEPHIEFLEANVKAIDPGSDYGLACGVVIGQWLAGTDQRNLALEQLTGLEESLERRLEAGSRYAIRGLRLLGRLYRESGEADEEAAILMKLAPCDPAAAIGASKKAEERGDLDGATEILKQQLANPAVAIRASKLYERLAGIVPNGRDVHTAEAVRVLRLPARTSCDAALRLSDLLTDQEEIVEVLGQVAKTSPHCALRLAKIYRGRGEVDKAIRLTGQHQDNPDCAIEYARTLADREAGDTEEAIRVLSALAPWFPRAATTRASILNGTQGLDVAIRSLEELPVLSPSTAAQLAKWYGKRGIEDDKVRGFELTRGFLTNMDCMEAHTRLGFETGELDLDQAMELLRPAAQHAANCGRQLLWFTMQAHSNIGSDRIISLSARYTDERRIFFALVSRNVPCVSQVREDVRRSLNLDDTKRTFLGLILDENLGDEWALRQAIGLDSVAAITQNPDDSWTVKVVPHAPLGLASWSHARAIGDCLHLKVVIDHPGAR